MRTRTPIMTSPLDIGLLLAGFAVVALLILLELRAALHRAERDAAHYQALPPFDWSAFKHEAIAEVERIFQEFPERQDK